MPPLRYSVAVAGAENEMRKYAETLNLDDEFSNIVNGHNTERSTSTTTTKTQTIYTSNGKRICKTTTIVSRVSTTRLDLFAQPVDEGIQLEPQG